MTESYRVTGVCFASDYPLPLTRTCPTIGQAAREMALLTEAGFRMDGLSRADGAPLNEAEWTEWATTLAAVSRSRWATEVLRSHYHEARLALQRVLTTMHHIQALLDDHEAALSAAAKSGLASALERAKRRRQRAEEDLASVARALAAEGETP